MDLALVSGRILELIKDDKNEKKHENFKASRDHFEEMSWHVYGTKPERLLKRVRPREDPAIRNYRLESYEPITKSYCKKGLSITGKIFNPKLYSIRFSDDKKKESEILKRYSLEDYPKFNSIINYFSGFVLKKMIADPNGVILCQPYRYDFKENERVEPFLTSYNSDQIHHLSEEYVLLFDKFEEYGRKKEWYYTYVDKIRITKLCFVQMTNNNSGELEIKAEYMHNFKSIPIWHLGGDYSEVQDGVLQSYFFDAVPFWNEAINDHSDANGNYRLHINSQRWEIADECEYIESKGGISYSCDGGFIFDGEEKHKCPGCGGSGYKKTATGPFDVYQVERAKAFGGDEGQLPLPPFGYVSPPFEGLKMLEERVNRNLEQGLSAINMDVVNKIGENQSGVAKEIDRTELNDFLQKIADQFFEIHLPNTYYYFIGYMFGVEVPNPEERRKIEPEISKPTQFNVWSTSELTEQLKSSKQAGLNPSYLTYLQKAVQSQQFQTKPTLLKEMNLELMLDPLAEVSRDDVSLMLANKTITQETAIIHDNISTFMKRAIAEDNKFMEKSYEEQVEVLEGYAKEIVDANRITIDTTLIDDGGNGDSPIDTPVDVEAEAKAKLKGSVGGVQGLIQIQESVASGITDYEAAVTMLYEIFGFDDTIARKLLGNKADLEKAKPTEEVTPPNDTGSTFK